MRKQYEKEECKISIGLRNIAAIGDEKSLNLFNSMAAKGISIEDLLNEHKMSRKQYYLRISKFIETGMIKRKGGKYILTLFGKVIHEVQLILLELIKSHWQLKAVDSLGSMKENTGKECKQVFVDHLIENAGMVPIAATIVGAKVVK
jgi:phage antirepressor YoqD-like protein